MVVSVRIGRYGIDVLPLDPRVSCCSKEFPIVPSALRLFISTGLDDGASSANRLGMSCAGDLDSEGAGSGLSPDDIMKFCKNERREEFDDSTLGFTKSDKKSGWY